MNPTVLVVDDDADVRTCVEETLSAAGYAVVGARDGRAALDYLRSAPPPSLILLDLMMPKVSGWDLLQHLHDSPTLDAIPVVVFTGAHEPKESVLGKTVLRKPIDPELLVDLVDALHREDARFVEYAESPQTLLGRSLHG